MSEEPPREAMEYDVVIVGAGPAGLSAAIRLKQQAEAAGADITVAVVEKGSEVGAHILSGAVIDPKALDELIPDWKAKGAPLETAVTQDRFLALGPHGDLPVPMWPMPGFMHNHGCYIASLGNVCRWLASQAEALGVEIYPGMAASELVFNDQGAVKGVVAGVFGVARDGHHKGDFQPGLELHAKYTLIAEGARGSLAKQLLAGFNLTEGHEPQKFGIGLKELWQVPEENFHPGLVQHTVGWPLDSKTGGGSFMYHFGDRYVAIGFVVHLNYANPWLSPFDEFQRLKHHPSISQYLTGGRRIAYGARAITEGGFQSVPKLAFPGGALVGCSAGFVNLPRIKGSHNAMKTGMLAAEAAFAAIQAGRSGDELADYQSAYERSWVFKELRLVRNAKPLWSRLGTWLGSAMIVLELNITNWFGGFSPLGTLKHGKTDAEATGLAKDFKPIDYPKPDGVLSFDKLSSVFLSATNHEEDHCKTCDIKDPSQNIVWTTPEGGGGPNYPNM